MPVLLGKRKPLTVLAMNVAKAKVTDANGTKPFFELMDLIPSFGKEVGETFKAKTSPVFIWRKACKDGKSWVAPTTDFPVEIFDALQQMAVDAIEATANEAEKVTKQGNADDDSDESEEDGTATKKSKEGRLLRELLKRSREDESDDGEGGGNGGMARCLTRLARTVLACTGLAQTANGWKPMQVDESTEEGREFATILRCGASYRFLEAQAKVGGPLLLDAGLTDTLAFPWVSVATESHKAGLPLLPAAVVACGPARDAMLRALAPFIVCVWLRLEPHGSSPELPMSVALHFATLLHSQIKGTTRERLKTLRVSDYTWSFIVRNKLNIMFADFYPQGMATLPAQRSANLLISEQYGGGSTGIPFHGHQYERGGGGGGQQGERGGRGRGRGGGDDYGRGRGGGPAVLTCFKCQQSGHKAFDCPNQRVPRGGGPGQL